MYSQSLAAWEKVRGQCQKIGDGPGELEALERMARITQLHVVNTSQAEQYFLDALKIAEHLGEQNKQGELLNTLGIMEWQRQRFTEALCYYERALGIFRLLDDSVHSGLMLNSIGVTLRKLNRHDEALKRLEEAFQIHSETNEMLLQGHALAAMAQVHEDMNELEQALRCYETSLAVRQQIDDHTGTGWMNYQVARMQAALGSEDRARDHLGEAYIIADEYGDKKLRDLCGNLQGSLNK